MGSIFSAPKAPPARAPLVFNEYVPAPVQPLPQITTKTSSQTTETKEKAPEVVQRERREKNLLVRNAGRFGTIKTGFRGLLETSNNQSRRKSLLGE